MLLEREPELGGNAPILGACPLDESLVIVRSDERTDRDSLECPHEPEHSNQPASYVAS